jgi:hypothetical protein
MHTNSIIMSCHVKWTRREVYIFNGSKRVIYVNAGDGNPTYALDSGATGIITRKGLGGVAGIRNTLVTLTYYSKTHDLVTIVLQDSGTWTTSTTSPDPSSCYTNDSCPACKSLRDASLTQRPSRNSQGMALLRECQY